MQKYRLERVIQYTERLEVEAENWEEATKMLRDDTLDFERQEDDILHDENIEFLGDC